MSQLFDLSGRLALVTGSSRGIGRELARALADAGATIILHGRDDAVIPHAQARAFSDALRGAGARTVAYAEIPNAHHAFDTLATLRCQLTAEAVAAFLGIVYGHHVAARGRRRRAVGSAS